jgi:RNA polymerase sigma-70 factor, ECF subfamily
MAFDGVPLLQALDSPALLDDAAFAGLWRRERSRLLGLATRMTGSAADAEEVVQEAFLQAWRARARFAGQSKASTWLYRITANAALMHLRSRRRRPMDLVDDIAAVAVAEDVWLPALPDPLATSLAREQRAAVWAAVDRLPARDRDLVRDVLADRDDDDLGAHGSAAARKSRLTRSRQRLRCDAGLAAVI